MKSKSFKSKAAKAVRQLARVFMGFLLILAIASPFVAYKMSETTVTFKIKTLERVVKKSGDSVDSYYLVYTDKGVYKNSDNLLYFKFNSADLQNNLIGAKMYHRPVTVRVVGWRVPLFSMHKNIISIKRTVL